MKLAFSTFSEQPATRAAREYWTQLQDELRALGPGGEELLQRVEKDAEPTWNLINRIEHDVLPLLPYERLLRRANVIRNRYRDVAGTAKYQLYVESKPPSLTEATPESKAVLADTLELHQELIREYVLGDAIEQQRAVLSQRAARIALGGLTILGVVLEARPGSYWITYAIIVALVGMFLIGVVGRNTGARAIVILATAGAVVTLLIARPTGTVLEDACGNRPLSARTPATTITMVIIAGVLGGVFSLIRRAQQPVTDGDSLRNLEKLAAADRQFYLAPITGAIGALVVYAMFSAELLQGSLFPKVMAPSCVPNQPMTFLDFLHNTGPATALDHGKVLVWCFIAGFSERLLPDSLDRLTASASEQKK